MNLLLSLVNDVLDIKTIEAGKFHPRIETFNPAKLLDFIVSTFKFQAEMQRTSIAFKTISDFSCDLAIEHRFKSSIMHSEAMPQ